jgi:hypothetical protein
MDGRDETQGAKSPAESVDLVFLSDDAAVLAAVSAAHASLGNEAPSLRLVNLLDTASTAPVELRLEQALTHAKLAILRTTGKQSHAVIAGLADKAQQHGVLFAILAESEDGYESAAVQSSLPNTDYGALAVHFAIGTAESLAAALRHAAQLIVQHKGPAPDRISRQGHDEAILVVGERSLGEQALGFAATLVLLLAVGAGLGFFLFGQLQSRSASIEVTNRDKPVVDWPSSGFYPDDPAPNDDNDIVLRAGAPEGPVFAIDDRPELLMGRYAYGVPSVMIAGDPYFVSVTIAAPREGETTPQLDVRLATDTRETLGPDLSAPVRSGSVEIGSVMSAGLLGDDFVITPISAARQIVDGDGGATQWLWEVRGKAPGRASLVLRLSIEGDSPEDDRLVPSVIDIRTAADVFLSREQMAVKTPSSGNASPAALPALNSDTSGTTAAPASRAHVPHPVPDECKSSGTSNRKFALVIGNVSYTGIAPLTFPGADSVAMRDVLVESGFRVMHCEDLGADGLTGALDAFRDQVKAAPGAQQKIVAFYYSGHGASTPTENDTYLLPVSLRRATVGQIESHGLSVTQVITGLSNTGAKRLIVIIDACRDVMRLEDGEYRGLRLINWRASAYDIVAYATMWGEKARDNGRYAKFLAAAIRAMPDADVADVFNRVQTDVSRDSGEDQVPQYIDRMPDVLAFRN